MTKGITNSSHYHPQGEGEQSKSESLHRGSLTWPLALILILFLAVIFGIQQVKGTTLEEEIDVVDNRLRHASLTLAFIVALGALIGLLVYISEALMG